MAWNSDLCKENHNWIEVFDSSQGGWIFLEPSANKTLVDDLTTKPCSKWFCQSELFPPMGANQTQVFAARLVFVDTLPKTYYPLAWEPDCKDVPGEDLTDYYHRVCSHC